MNFLKAAGANALGVSTLLAAGGGSEWAGGPDGYSAETPRKPLPLIPMMDFLDGIEERISLKLQTSMHDFGNGGKSQTFGINHDYLGPVIRVKQGQTLPFDVTNAIDDVSTLHWHGLHIPGDVDGGPHPRD